MVRLSREFPAPKSWSPFWNKPAWDHDGYPVCILYKNTIRAYYSQNLSPRGFIGEIPLSEALPYLIEGEDNSIYKDVRFYVRRELSDKGVFVYIISLGETNVNGLILPDLEKIEKIYKDTPVWPLMVSYSTKHIHKEWEEDTLTLEELVK